MSVLLVLLGVLCLGVAIVDILWTTLWVEGGAGPLTSQMMAWTWRLLRRLSGDRQRILRVTGPAVFLLGLAAWIGLLWAGWTFVFAGVEDSLVDTRDTGPISWTERFYFVGYSLFTMGNGDFTPKDGVWQVATALTTASGMLFVTLIVSYVVSVLDAVTQKRALASSVSGLGQSGERIVRTAWDGNSFDGLALQFDSLTTEINELTTNHQAYPILHYFYAGQRRYAAVVAVVAFDDALTLLRFGVRAEQRPSKSVLGAARASVESYLDTVTASFARVSTQEPPTPDLHRLRAADVPTVSDDAFSRSLTEVTSRRQRLLGLVEADAREWPRPGDE
ncbi:potassium channel family protein [Halorientalis pallida]|uniref:Two pore domain potassium channel family protein n=1 Tax=Halorientalis pallida TaxID=2479928 RepID=A0A498KZH3_9EURY|nr:potassium channel family protein [Halorientalis pallida]RXK51136.1 two pore domain potassium channel family protein [Halorientalis pallida]